MVAYKLFRKRKDGSLGPLFINRKQRVPVGKWLSAECHPTTGYALRPGWHCTLIPFAPHLHEGKDRVWCMVVVKQIKRHQRPSSQGGTWLVAKKMRVIGEL